MSTEEGEQENKGTITKWFSRQSISELVTSTVLLISIMMAAITALGLLGNFDSGVSPEDQRFYNTMREVQRQGQERLDERFAELERLIEDAPIEDVVVAQALEELTDFRVRVEAIETLLDTQPREIVEIVRLRDDVLDLRDALVATQDRLIREMDRAYNLMVALVGSLMVAVITLIIANYLRREKNL